MAVFPAFFGLLMAVLVTGQEVQITPQKAVKNVGEQLDILCKVPYPIDMCRFNIGGDTYRLDPKKTTDKDNVVYHGNGVEAGECGAHIKSILPQYNGTVSCQLPPQSGAIELSASIPLIVASPPQNPHMEPKDSYFVEDTELRVRCTVAEGRPAADIKWYLDDEPILRGVHQAIITGANAVETITQNLTRVLTADDDNKTLYCKSEHMALKESESDKMMLHVRYAPKRSDSGTITIFGLKLGAPGRLNVTVRANPPPAAEWRVGDVSSLRPGQTVRTMTALPPVPLGGGYYNISLHITEIAKEDVDLKYYLTVSNELGSQEFTLTISTLDEPVGVELGTGAILGIVVAVLALLVAVFLVVFAKATDRWCFAGGHRRDHTKSSGESTPAGDVLLESGLALSPTCDTESAVGGRERSRLAQLSARVRGVLPRAKDKVQATEAPQPAAAEQKPLSEEKKGVVYAELQLGEQTAEKPPPPSTEYAEICYTDQPKETKE